MARPPGADEDGGRPPKDPMHEGPLGDDDKPKPGMMPGGMMPGSVCKEQFDDCVESGMERKTCDDARRACEQMMMPPPDEMTP